MKADLTLPEVREAFQAQYINQPVYRGGFGRFVKVFGPHMIGFTNPLHLRHISSPTEDEIFWHVWHLLSDQSIEPIAKDELTIDITNDDGGAVQVEFDLRCGSGTISFQIDNDLLRIKAWMEDETDIVLNHGDGNDFLRSIGILIPYRGNSCEELIESGLAVYRKEKVL